jgi:hypothetical protein
MAVGFVIDADSGNRISYRSGGRRIVEITTSMSRGTLDFLWELWG